VLVVDDDMFAVVEEYRAEGGEEVEVLDRDFGTILLFP
jgi:hypothetical protein